MTERCNGPTPSCEVCGRKPELSVVVQAGGFSTRMGFDKARACFCGRPLIERVLEQTAPAASELIVSTSRPHELSFLAGFAPLGLPVRVVRDLPGEPGAMCGIASSLSAATRPLVAVIACDMPFVSAPLLSALASRLERDGLDACVPRTTAGLEPLCAVWRRDACLPVAADLLAHGKQRIRLLIDSVNTGFLDEAEVLAAAGSLDCFVNVNTRDELLRAERAASVDAVRVSDISACGDRCGEL